MNTIYYLLIKNSNYDKELVTDVHQSFREAEAFDGNWSIAPEAQYLHWTRCQPQNQIQFAFRQHWETFKNILGAQPIGKDVLEGLWARFFGAIFPMLAGIARFLITKRQCSLPGKLFRRMVCTHPLMLVTG